MGTSAVVTAVTIATTVLIANSTIDLKSLSHYATVAFAIDTYAMATAATVFAAVTRQLLWLQLL